MQRRYEDRNWFDAPMHADPHYVITLMASVGFWPMFWYGFIQALFRD